MWPNGDQALPKEPLPSCQNTQKAASICICIDGIFPNYKHFEIVCLPASKCEFSLQGSTGLPREALLKGLADIPFGRPRSSIYSNECCRYTPRGGVDGRRAF